MNEELIGKVIDKLGDWLDSKEDLTTQDKIDICRNLKSSYEDDRDAEINGEIEPEEDIDSDEPEIDEDSDGDDSETDGDDDAEPEEGEEKREKKKHDKMISEELEKKKVN